MKIKALVFCVKWKRSFLNVAHWEHRNSTHRSNTTYFTWPDGIRASCYLTKSTDSRDVVFCSGNLSPMYLPSNEPTPLLLDEEKHCFAGGRTSQVGSVGWNFFFLVAQMTLNTKKFGEKWTLFVENFFEKYSDFCQTTRFWQTKKNVPTIKIWVSRTHKTEGFFSSPYAPGLCYFYI